MIPIDKDPTRTCPVDQPIPITRNSGCPFESLRLALRRLFFSLQKNGAEFLDVSSDNRQRHIALESVDTVIQTTIQSVNF